MSKPVKNDVNTWGYRVIRTVTNWKAWFNSHGETLPEGHPETEDVLQVHSVYYDKNGKIHAWSEEATFPIGETIEELKADAARYVAAMDDPILNLTDLPDKDALPLGVVDPKKDLKKVALTAAEIIAKAKENEVSHI